MKMQNLSAKLGARLQKRTQRGFTLVEIAIVLLIIGLLLGGILRGQEIITNARVRNVLETKEGIKAAIYAFRDRYAQGATLPGDLDATQAGQIGVSAATGAGDGLISSRESPILFQNLAAKGLIGCTKCTATTSASAGASVNDSPVNPWGGVMWVASVSPSTSVEANSDTYANANATDQRRLGLSVGNMLPDIALILDGKTDDLNPQTGNYRMGAAYMAVNTAGVAGCTGTVGTAGVAPRWLTESAGDTSRSIACNGVWFID